MAQKSVIKTRIKSINATKKITSAMKLIASVKLQKQRNVMLKNREYSYTLKDTFDKIMTSNIDVENVFFKFKTSKSKLYIVYCSDLGLCGGYNSNVEKMASSIIKDDDLVYLIGSNLFSSFSNKYNLLNNEIINSDSIKYIDIKKIADKAIELYKNNEVSSINIIYTKFVNNVKFEPTISTVLPCEKNNDNKKDNKELLLEPDPNTILDDLIPLISENEFYAKFLESKTSEQGARRFAMENATDNAEELTDELLLAYNQARQAAITQEITEIISGADAI